MTLRTLKHRIGCYIWKRYLVPMRDKKGNVIHYADGTPRTRHVKSFNEFIGAYRPLLNKIIKIERNS